MKLLGADDWFILWPFIIEGVVIGIIEINTKNSRLMW